MDVLTGESTTPSRPGPFSDAVMDHFRHPRCVGRFDAPHGEGCAGSPDSGPFVRIQVLIEKDHVEEARFQTYGCIPAIAAASFVCEWAAGRAIQEALNVPADFVEESLEGLPPDRQFCAVLVVEALQTAVRNGLHRVERDVRPEPRGSRE